MSFADPRAPASSARARFLAGATACVASAALSGPLSCSKHDSPAAATALSPTSNDGGPKSTDQAADGAGATDEVDARFPGRVAAMAWEVKVHEQPSLSSAMIGYLRAGAVVPAVKEPVSRDGCAGGWRAISPVGFVCVETNVATTQTDSPIAIALSHRADLSGRLPYMYGLVRQHSPIYSRLPTRAEAAHAEYALRQHMEHWLRAPDGASFRSSDWLRWQSEPGEDARMLWASQATQGVPAWLDHGAQPPGNLSGMAIGRRLVIGQTIEHQGFAFVDTAVSEGRRYGITTDLLVVPVDRLRPIEGSDFHGVRIPEDIDVPFALVRRDGAFLYEYEPQRAAMRRREKASRRAAFKLTGKEQVVEERRFYETTDGKWLAASHASRIDGFRRPLTKWAQEGERWVDISIGNQTLVAFEGTKPVYATLVSTGEAGLGDPQTTKSTIVGDFRVFAKHLTTTMSSEVVGEEFQLKDIPYVQYFQEGYALHAAYWHDDFGVPRSHGCVNLSPEDAKWLFSWTEPHVPTGWHGARAKDDGSVVRVHE